MAQLFNNQEPKTFSIRILSPDTDRLVFLTVTKIILEEQCLILYNDENIVLISPSSFHYIFEDISDNIKTK